MCVSNWRSVIGRVATLSFGAPSASKPSLWEPASSSCRNTPPTSIRSSRSSKFKTLLRKAEARSYEAISDACGKILAQYPPAESAAYIKNAGYA